MHGCCVPKFLAYEHVKVPVPEGRRREPKTLIYCWQRVVVFPDAPVFHAQLVTSDPSTQYGALNVLLGITFPEVSDTCCATCLELLRNDVTFDTANVNVVIFIFPAVNTHRVAPSGAVVRPRGARHQEREAACGGRGLRRKARLVDGAQWARAAGPSGEVAQSMSTHG